MSIFLTNNLTANERKSRYQLPTQEEDPVATKWISLTQHSRNYIKYKRDHSLPTICEREPDNLSKTTSYDIEANLELGKVVRNCGNFTNHIIRQSPFDQKEPLKEVNITMPFFKMHLREASPKSPKSRHISLVKNKNCIVLPYLQTENTIQAMDRNKFKKIPNAIIFKPHYKKTVTDQDQQICTRYKNSDSIKHNSVRNKRTVEGQTEQQCRISFQQQENFLISRNQLRFLEDFKKGHSRFNEIIQNVKKKLGRNFRDPL